MRSFVGAYCCVLCCTIADMDRDHSWLMAGAAFGLGFTAVCALTVAAWVWYDNQRTVRAMEAAARAVAPTYRYETRSIPPGSRNECLAQTGGVANERYWECRNGRTVRVRIPITRQD